MLVTCDVLFIVFLIDRLLQLVSDMQFVCPQNKKQHAENMAENRPAILKLFNHNNYYAQEFIPKLCCSTLPTPMMELYNPEALHMRRVMISISVHHG